MPRAWGLHGSVLPAVPAALTLALWLLSIDSPVDFDVMLAGIGLPFAIVYAIMATAMVAVLPPGRGWIAPSHGIGLALGSVALLYIVH